MLEVRTVLCPVDFSDLTERELGVAVEICRTFDARLVLHHNLDCAPPAWSKSWEYDWTHPGAENAEEKAEKAMGALLRRVPESVRAEGTISRGLVVPVLMHLVETLPADILLLGCHGRSCEEHASVAERIIERCPCPVMTLHDGKEDGPFVLKAEGTAIDVLVPTDFSPSAESAARYAFEMARTLPVNVHLLHVVSTSQKMMQALAVERNASSSAGAVEEARQKLVEMVPEDLAERVSTTVESGPVVETMTTCAERIHPRLLIMGRHAQGFFQHFFTQDTSREMLHRASCPVVYAA